MTTATMPEPLALDAKTLAASLHVAVRTIRSMDAGGRLPRPVRLNGRCVRWPLEDIKAWLAAGSPGRADWEAIKHNGRAER